jgi:hypothetical protein
MALRAILATLLVAVALGPRALSAQAAAAPVPGSAPLAAALGPGTPAGSASTTVASGPRWFAAVGVLDGPLLGAPRGTASLPPLAPMFPPRHRKPGVALMIVGGAGIVVGALIGSDLITVGGAGVGLYGLYLYVR